MSYRDFLNAYIECAEWADCGPDHETHGADFSLELVAQLAQDAGRFYGANADAIERTGAAQAGHDFWLTRNGHGAGFWDRDGFDDSEELRALDAAATAFGPCELYLGDDGLVYAC